MTPPRTNNPVNESTGQTIKPLILWSVLFLLSTLFLCCSGVTLTDGLPEPPSTGVRTYTVVETWVLGKRVFELRAGCSATVTGALSCGVDTGPTESPEEGTQKPQEEP